MRILYVVAYKCFDYKCNTCIEFFEVFFDNAEHDGTTATCPNCGATCDRVFIHASQLDTLAAGAWNGLGVDNGYSDKSKFRADLERKGKIIKEPGLEKDAEENEKAFMKKKFDAFDEKVDNYIKDFTIDELHKKIAVDAEIHKATLAGDARKIKSMGGLTSVDEAYERANK